MVKGKGREIREKQSVILFIRYSREDHLSIDLENTRSIISFYRVAAISLSLSFYNTRTI